jgi:hypothetical protein
MEHSAWLNSLYENLEKFEAEGYETAAYLRVHRTKINFKRNKASTGAWWTIAGNINLNSIYYSYDKSLDETRILMLIIHEVRHLQQGFLTALTVYGELDAWQLEWNLYHRIHNRYPHPAIEELVSLPLGWDRDVLRRAVELMQVYAGKGYRADLLPYYPLGKEIAFRLFRRVPKASLGPV